MSSRLAVLDRAALDWFACESMQAGRVGVSACSRSGLGGDPGDGGLLVHALDRGDLAGEPVERRLIELPLGEALPACDSVPAEISHNLGDHAWVAAVDLRLIILRPSRPQDFALPRPPLQHGERLIDQLPGGDATQADGTDLRRRNP